MHVGEEVGVNETVEVGVYVGIDDIDFVAVIVSDNVSVRVIVGLLEGEGEFVWVGEEVGDFEDDLVMDCVEVITGDIVGESVVVAESRRVNEVDADKVAVHVYVGVKEGEDEGVIVDEKVGETVAVIVNDSVTI